MKEKFTKEKKCLENIITWKLELNSRKKWNQKIYKKEIEEKEV